MYDIVFVDTPFIPTDVNYDLGVEIDKYREESEKILTKVTNKVFYAKPLHYTSGILCLSSYLKQEILGIKVGYVHQEINISQLDDYAKSSKVMAFSTMTFSMPQIINLAQKAKAANPRLRIILGGYHATYFPRELLNEYSFIDGVFLKEGEKALLQYMKGAPLSQIRGFAYRDMDKKIHIDSECDCLTDDEIPVPDYSLIKENINLFNISLTTMRGCIGQCRFCVNNDYWSSPRLVPIYKIIDELKLLKTLVDKGCVIHINDNIFTYHFSRVNNLYEMMQENGLTDYFIFECDTLANLVSVPIVRVLRKIGVYKICIGLEDCCDGVLRISNKPVSYAQNLEALRTIKMEAPDICVYVYWIIGLPGSTTETMDQNLRTMYDLIVDRTVDIISPKVFIPYPGTEFFNGHTNYGIADLSCDWTRYERRNPPYPYRYADLPENTVFTYLLAALRTCHQAYQCVLKEQKA